jgi:hypothetical protein
LSPPIVAFVPGITRDGTAATQTVVGAYSAIKNPSVKTLILTRNYIIKQKGKKDKSDVIPPKGGIFAGHLRELNYDKMMIFRVTAE